MKLVQHFTDFLADTVSLNATRLTQMDDSAEALKTFLRQSDWKPRIKSSPLRDHGPTAPHCLASASPMPTLKQRVDAVIARSRAATWAADAVAFRHAGQIRDAFDRCDWCSTVRFRHTQPV